MALLLCMSRSLAATFFITSTRFRTALLTAIVSQGAWKHPRGPQQNVPARAQCTATALDLATGISKQPAGKLPTDEVFSKEDFDNFLMGYRSQYNEHDFWVSEDMIEGECLSATASIPII